MGAINDLLRGKVIREVYRNEVSLVIRCEGDFEIQIGWADAQQNPVKGDPVIVYAGKARESGKQTAGIMLDVKR